MKKQLLVDMLMRAYDNRSSKHILNLAIQIEQDVNIPHFVCAEDFSNEFYSVRDIRWVKQCINFTLF